MIHKPVSLDLDLEGLSLQGPFWFYTFCKVTGEFKLSPGWPIFTHISLTLSSSGTASHHGLPMYFVWGERDNHYTTETRYPHVSCDCPLCPWTGGVRVRGGVSGSCSPYLLQVHQLGSGRSLGPSWLWLGPPCSEGAAVSPWSLFLGYFRFMHIALSLCRSEEKVHLSLSCFFSWRECSAARLLTCCSTAVFVGEGLLVLIYSPLLSYTQVESSGTELVTSSGLVSGLSSSDLVIFLPGQVLSWEMLQCLSRWTPRKLILLCCQACWLWAQPGLAWSVSPYTWFFLGIV